MICNSCRWCATYFGIDVTLSSPIACHGCSLHNTELIPIETDESFRIEYNPIRGTEIEFYKAKYVVARDQSANNSNAKVYQQSAKD